jgi:hypothetical protein
LSTELRSRAGGSLLTLGAAAVSFAVGQTSIVERRYAGELS